MREEGRYGSSAGLTIADMILIILAIIVVAAIFFPVLTRRHSPERNSFCQSNLKELALTLQMYCEGYDGMLPSSYLCGGSKTWNRRDFVEFAGIKGPTPPPTGGRDSSWPMLLYPFMKNKDIIWCLSDPVKRDDPTAAVSYYYKAAIDRAWYGGFKKESDFDNSSYQVVFWEHNGWHWGQADKGVTNGTGINVAYLDGHISAKRIRNSGYTLQENPPGPLPRSGMGEPAWFNCDMKTMKRGNGAYWNPNVYGDYLQHYLQ